MKVDAAPLREHVAALLDRGATARGIAEASKEDARTIGRLAIDPTDAAKSGAILRFDATRAARILAVSLSDAEAGEALRRRPGRPTPPRRQMVRSAPVVEPAPVVELIGVPEPVRPRSRREAVDCAVDVAKLHTLPLDAFVARQLDVTLPEAQDLLRQARRDGLLPASVRPRSAR